MLSYQHSYHAGNLVDAHKHARLAEMLVARPADAPTLAYYETHAGRGLYDLSSKEAKKTGEAKMGAPVIAALPKSHPYRQCIAQTQKRYGPRFYPGSPLIAQHLLHRQDTIQLFELHPQEHAALRTAMPHDRVQIEKADGYAGMLSLPTEQAARNGLLLIDPSYELKNEYADMAPWLQQLLRRSPNLSVLLWYPILKSGLHEPMRKALMQAFPTSPYEEVPFPADSGLRMLGSGLWQYTPLSSLESPQQALT